LKIFFCSTEIAVYEDKMLMQKIKSAVKITLEMLSSQARQRPYCEEIMSKRDEWSHHPKY
jgi:hypothetical protein